MHSEQLPHHIRQQVCTTREPYRDCKKEKAVKVLFNYIIINIIINIFYNKPIFYYFLI